MKEALFMYVHFYENKGLYHYLCTVLCRAFFLVRLGFSAHAPNSCQEHSAHALNTSGLLLFDGIPFTRQRSFFRKNENSVYNRLNLAL
jgi:hypothetical protein